MRLTLRTLLAYLDNTLDKDDAEALRVKLSESGFATQLVQRIRGSLINEKLSAPAHDAVNPIAEANVISEYLDSTLAAEQVAEIERICLDSDMHLSEAAACHQILTMVLGKPASVPDELRNRIYEFPDRDVKDIAVGAKDEVPKSGSFASVSLPEADTLTGIAADVPEEPVLVSSAPPVPPVGRSDSGVSDAPNRIRESGTIEEDGAAIAGSRGRDQIEKSDLYGGIRASRITPWLVSLALAGVFLFSLIRILDPLLNPVAKNDTEADKISDLYPELSPEESREEEIVVSAADAPIMESVGTPGVDIQPTQPDSLPAPDVASDGLPAPESLPAPTEGTSDLPMPKSIMRSTESVDSVDTKEMPAPLVADAPSPESADVTGKSLGSDPPPVVAAAESPDVEKTMDATDAPAKKDHSMDAVVPETKKDAVSDLPIPDSTEVVAAEMKAAEMKADADPGMKTDADAAKPGLDPGDTVLAMYQSDTSLLFAQTDDVWNQIAKDSGVTGKSVLLNSPKSRSMFKVGDKATVELVDATRLQFQAVPDDEEVVAMEVDFGRLLIKSFEAGVSMNLGIGEKSVVISLQDIDSVAAVEMRYARRPGFDTFSEKNHLMLARVVAVKGGVTVSSDGVDETVEVGKQWIARGSDPAQLTAVPKIPEWIDGKDGSPLDASARSGLMELLKQEQPLMLSLQEATIFRKSEVAALAAQTMLYLDRADVFFGSDGVLSNPKQRSYWKDHYAALQSVVNQSPEAAKGIRDNIGKMDAADGASLFRLLTGYSQNQLVEGADEELVEMLDSASMSVRVLALENLREITGVNLNFRPEEDNAVRRKSAVKKWEVRQRKGDIRWEN